MTLTFQALLMFAALGVVVLTSEAANRTRRLAMLAGAFAAGAVWIRPSRVPDASAVALPASLRQLLDDVDRARRDGALSRGGLEHRSCEKGF